jgi:hypothetical protein
MTRFTGSAVNSALLDIFLHDRIRLRVLPFVVGSSLSLPFPFFGTESPDVPAFELFATFKSQALSMQSN